ncbi:MAG: ABC transporter ATP-binding protein [Alphaproteobacteria bacterium]
MTKAYGDHVAVHEFSLSIVENEFVVLLGPSGCGKSTLLKLIAGIEDVTDGEIYVGGKLVNYIAPRDRDVAMVFQNYALYPHMTVAQNIAFPLRARWSQRPPRAEVSARVREAARLVDLESQLGKLPGQLSGGQRQRVALARAIIRQPVAFLMDEPLSNLDALLRTEMRRNLLDVHAAVGRANVYVTHDQLEAMTMADRIVVLRDGRLQQVGTPHDVYQRPANLFVAGFVGSPAMNFVPAEIADDGTAIAHGIAFAAGARFGARPERAVTLGIRPSDLVVAPPADAPNRMEGTVARVEYAGSDQYCDVALSDALSLRVRARPDVPLAVGQPIALAIAPAAVHAFDPDGTRIAEDRPQA